jgi:hypothetical protein
MIRKLRGFPMAQTVQQALAAAKLYSDGELYKIIWLPPNGIIVAAGILAEIATPFSALIVDKDEVTLVLAKADLDDYARRLPGHRTSDDDYRLITFDVELEPTLTGFMAHISKALAEAKVVIMPFAAFNRDHLLVPAAQFEQAMTVLVKLQSQSKSP